MKKTSRLLALLLALTMIVGLLASCGGSPSQETTSEPVAETQEETQDETQEETEEPQEQEHTKLAIVVSGTFGQQTYADVCLAGCERAAEEFGLELIKVENIDPATGADTLRTLIEQGITLFAFPIGSHVDGIKEVAPDHPEVKFIVTDLTEYISDNVLSLSYREQEGSFLLGAFASLMSQSGKVAYIGHNPGGAQVKFEQGFFTGAKYINPDVETTSVYVGYNDANKAKESSLLLYKQGYDYISTAAAASNLGVYEAAMEMDGEYYALGAADGQFYFAPEKIVASQLKRGDNSIYSFVKSVMEGTYEGGLQVEGVAEDGIQMLYTTHNDELRDSIPQEVTDQIEELEQLIIDGTLVIPATEEEFAAFEFPEN